MANSEESVVEIFSLNKKFLCCSSSSSFCALLSHMAWCTISDVVDEEGIILGGKPTEEAAAEAAAAVIWAINVAIASFGTIGGKSIRAPSILINIFKEVV